MSETVVKSLKVTFNQSLPMGTRGVFTHEGETWIAYPAKKNQQIFMINDRLIAIHKAIQDDLIRWINDWPTDSVRVNAVLERVARGLALNKELIHDKTEVAIS